MCRASRMLLLVGVTLLSVLSTCTGEHWAVIVAGSKGYDNYRHQADACHAYHVVRRHGIPAENVILMMYDDVATAKENKFPGKLFNRPSSNSSEALEVYEGCHVDYRGDDVTPEMFLHVLLGDKTATRGKKVLESTAEDRVFVNFVDHGARGFVLFPKGEMLTSSQLTGTMKKMFAAKRYKELVFYVEACHSGSMFYSWSMSHINAYVTTAANGWESSWGTYCPPMDVVNGVAMDTCLGDLYSVNWMEDSDRTDLSKESIKDQFNLIKTKTTMSHVEQFGSNRIRREIVGNFQSNYDQPAADMSASSEDRGPATDEQAGPTQQGGSSVDAHDIPVVLAFYRYLRSQSGSERTRLAEELIRKVQSRERADRVFAAIQMEYAKIAVEPANAVDDELPAECTTRVFALLKKHCRLHQDADVQHGMDAYSLQYAGILTQLCASGAKVENMDAVFQHACSEDSSTRVYDTNVLSVN